MAENSGQDVVIRSRPTLDGTEFIVMCGQRGHLLGGPFGAMADAMGFAEAQGKDGPVRVLYEVHDVRGRTLGERLLLRTAPPNSTGVRRP